MAKSDAFYLELQAEVVEVLEDFGTTYTIRAEGVYNSDTLETADGATRTVTGLVANEQFVSSLGNAETPANVLASSQVGKKNLVLSAFAAPQPGEEVQVDGKWFALSKLIPIKPAEIVVVYMLDITL